MHYNKQDEKLNRYKEVLAQSSNTPPPSQKKVILLINIHIFLILICYIHPLNLYPPLYHILNVAILLYSPHYYIAV